MDAFWTFTTAIWTHRNYVVHGDTIEAQAKILLEQLHTRVRTQFTVYSLNPSIVLPRHQYLFTTQSLQQRLLRSYDHLACWLASVEEAIQVCQQHTTQDREAAQRFFPTTPLNRSRSSSYDSTYEASTISRVSTNLYSTEATISDMSTTYTSTLMLYDLEILSPEESFDQDSSHSYPTTVSHASQPFRSIQTDNTPVNSPDSTNPSNLSSAA